MRELPNIPQDSQAHALLEGFVKATEDQASGVSWATKAYEGLCARIGGYEVSLRCNGTHQYLAIKPPLPDLPELSNKACTHLGWVLPGEGESWREYVLDRLYSAASWNRGRGRQAAKDDELLHECREYASQWRTLKLLAPDGATLTFLKELDTFVPRHPADGVGIGTYCVDQAPSRAQYFDRHFLSFLTPHGIRELDSWFGRQIRSLEPRPGTVATESGVSPGELKDMILANPHLHDVIKTDLLHNLENYARSAAAA